MTAGKLGWRGEVLDYVHMYGSHGRWACQDFPDSILPVVRKFVRPNAPAGIVRFASKQKGQKGGTKLETQSKGRGLI